MNVIYPEVTQGIVNRVTTSYFRYQGWPSVARDENGTLYAVASSFRTHHIDTFGKTAMYISKDEGKTWTPPIVINDTFMDDRDAGILYMGNGKLLVSWFTHSREFYQETFPEYIVKYAPEATKKMVAGGLEDYNALPEEVSNGGSYIRISEDYGVTWGDIIKVPVSSPHGPNICKDGSLIYLGNKMYDNSKYPDNPDKNNRCAFCKSIDGGQNWEELHVFPMPEWLQGEEYLCECHVTELPDGKLLGAFRYGGRPKHFTVATTVSEDGGYTWSDIVSTEANGAPPHLLVHSSGAVICSIGRREEPFGPRAVVSYDNGETWTEEYVLDDRAKEGDLGYPATVELDDGSLITVYYQKFPGDDYCSVLYSKWSLQK